MKTLVVVSDIHHAGPAERARRGFESRSIPHPFQRVLARTYRRWFWMRDPFCQPGQFDRFLEAAGEPDLLVANGDFSVDSGFIGLADPAVFETVRHCVERLRQRFGERFYPVIGDHELGKLNLMGGYGGLRLGSFDRAVHGLGFEPFWQVEWGQWVLMGVTSTLVALPLYEPEILPAEAGRWTELRAVHLEKISQALDSLRPDQKVLLFCHDPSALFFLGQEPAVRARSGQIERTIVGHLHSELVLKLARLLAGMPDIRWMGNTVRRYSWALRRARSWEPFRVLLCPSIKGIQLRKDGGFLRLCLEEEAMGPIQVERMRLGWVKEEKTL